MAGKFFTTVRDLRAGATLDDLDSAIAEIVDAVRTTRKTGELILRIKIRPPRKDTATYLQVEDDVVVKLPKRDRADTIFFPLADNSLSRSDPSQRSLPLRSVGEPGVVDTDTGEISSASGATAQ